MTALTADRAVSLEIDTAVMILRDTDAAPWPSSDEAKAVLSYARGRLLEVLDLHARILHGSLDWDRAVPDARSEDDALWQVAAEALDQALALKNRLAEYQRAANNTTWGAAAAAGGRN
jgi:hypothetical protein